MITLRTLASSLRSRLTACILLAGIISISLLTDAAYSTVNVQNEDITNSEDKDITRAVEMKLRADEGVSAHLIDVRTKNGIVTLSGLVDTILAKDRACKIAETIKGVLSVRNVISVIPIIESDNQITLHVREVLSLDPAIDTSKIDIQVSDRRIVLYGKVGSWGEKELIGQVVKGVKGIKDIKNTIAIDYGEKRLDSEIKADIERRFKFDRYLHDKLINVLVHNNKVRLQGIVRSAAEKSRAFNNAWVIGVVSVDSSRLEVTRQIRNEPCRKDKFLDKSHEEIKRAIEDAFFYHPRVALFNITVEVNNGVVTLNGTVDNLKAKRTAKEVAMNIIGVRKVRNYLKVRPRKLPHDSTVMKNIHNALSINPVTDRFDILTQVQNNKVYLYGTVDTFFDKNTAGNVVGRVPGVVNLVNKLNVDYRWAWKRDEEIYEDIKSRLYWNIFVDSDNISPQVNNGAATLFGVVDNQEEAFAAIKDAFDGGAKIVKSYLKVGKEKEEENNYRKAKRPYYYYPEYFYDFYSSPYY